MGNVASTFLRPIRRPAANWNIENRAQKLLDRQDKPSPAPRHPSTKDKIDHFVQGNPEIAEELQKKNLNLDKMLKGLVVEPEKMGEIVPKTESRRALPVDRSNPAVPEFGYLEPETVRPGRCTIRQVLIFLSEHVNNANTTGSPEAIAKRYNLDLNNVNNVLKYFNIFNIHVPKQADQAKSSLRETVLRAGSALKGRSLASGKKDMDISENSTMSNK